MPHPSCTSLPQQPMFLGFHTQPSYSFTTHKPLNLANLTMGDNLIQGPFAAKSNPVIVLVPGAWLMPILYRELVVLFDLSGYRTVIQQLPSGNSKIPDAHTVETDSNFVRNHLLLPEIRAGREVVLLMHSYGGFPGPVAANGLSKKELSSQGKRGGIIGMIMLSAVIALEGQSLLDKLIGKTYSAWILQLVRPPTWQDKCLIRS